jgi:ADP-heptose:LPS heptosyltransferase
VKQLLVIRFSAMGDVALLLPVLEAVLKAHPQTHIMLLTRKRFFPFFSHLPAITLYEADLEGRHKGLKGMWTLFQELRREYRFDAIIDQHQNLRSGFLGWLFNLTSVPVFTLYKGRREKQMLTRSKNKRITQLPHAAERYLQTFGRAGYKAETGPSPYFGATVSVEELLRKAGVVSKVQEKSPWIGLAPFAQHAQKMWPFENMAPFLELLYERYPEAKVFLMGGGQSEVEQLEELSQKFPQAILVAGKTSLSTELALISHFDLMVCMDSSNMHLAALSGIPVLSIWGATHPYAGFGPWQQDETHVLQVPTEELTCRPCSVFGNKPCMRGDLACLNRITPQMVMQRTESLLKTFK